MQMDTNYQNFCVNAILSQREACCVADAMLERCKKNDLDIPLSEESRKVLMEVLYQFAYLVRSIPFPKRLPHYATYEIDLFHECLQLGLVVYPEGTQFDEHGYPCTDDEDESGAESEDDNTEKPTYRPMIRIPIPTIPLKVWAEQNGVNRNTARAWVAQGRIKTFDEGGNECRVSAIQYLPDAPYANKKIHVRFRTPGFLPEKVVKKYPSLAGEVLDILITPVKDGVCTLIIISRPPEGKLGAQSLTIREDERAALVRTLLKDGDLKPSLDQCYRPPVGDPLSGAPYRYASLQPTAEDVAAVEKLRVASVCRNDTDEANGVSMPRFSMEFYNEDEDEPICSITGKTVNAKPTPEETLLLAVFDPNDLIECRNRVFSTIGGPKQGYAPWNQSIMFLTGIEYPIDAGKGILESIVRTLPRSANKGLSFSPTLLIATVPLDDANLDGIAELLERCGFAEVQEDKNDPYDDYRVFFAYANP